MGDRIAGLRAVSALYSAVFELTVQREFCAAHAIMMGGVREAVHGHNWRVTVTVAGRQLDGDGLLCDFHELERQLDEVIGPLDCGDLNATAPFDRVNPTAEHVALHIANSLIANSLKSGLPQGVRVAAVSVTEAPGCMATVREDG
jgi:6-pyruvoyltetrahydropterin/6-carboxytetrahydropterin synthase